jgi:O-antigen/teichoic acid export membrane protein
MGSPDATAADSQAARGDEAPSEPGRERRSLASDAAVIFLGGIFSQVAAIISLVALTHLLSRAEVGAYQQLLLIYAIASPLLIAGVPAALLYYMPRVDSLHEKHAWVGDAYGTLAALGLVAALGTVLLRHEIAAALSNPGLADALELYAPFIFFSFVNAVAPSALIASGRARTSAVLSAVNAGVWLLAVVLTAAAWGTVEGIAASISVVAGIMALVSLVVVVRAVGVRPPSNPFAQRGRKLVAYGIPLALTGALSMLGFQLDRLVVAHNFSPQRFAIYAVGAIEVPIAILIRQSMNAVLVPALSAQHAAGNLPAMAELWRGSMRKAGLVMLPMMVLLLVMAPELMRVAFGEKYEQSANIFRIYLALIPVGLASWGLLPMTAGRPGTNVGGAIAMLVVNGGLAIALVGPLGIYGPAIATPVALLATAAYFVWVIHRLLGFSPRELIPARALAATTAVGALCALPLFALKALPIGDLGQLIVAVPLFALPCLLVLRRFRLIDDLDWGRVTGFLRSARRTVAFGR